MTDDRAEREIERLKRKLAIADKRAEMAEAALPSVYVVWSHDFDTVASYHLTEAGAFAAACGDGDRVEAQELQR